MPAGCLLSASLVLLAASWISPGCLLVDSWLLSAFRCPRWLQKLPGGSKCLQMGPDPVLPSHFIARLAQSQSRPCPVQSSPIQSNPVQSSPVSVKACPVQSQSTPVQSQSQPNPVQSPVQSQSSPVQVEATSVPVPVQSSLVLCIPFQSNPG